MVRSNQFDASIYQYTILSKYIEFWQTTVIVVVLIVWSNIASTIQLLMINRNRCNDFISYFIVQALHSRNVVKKVTIAFIFHWSIAWSVLLNDDDVCCLQFDWNFWFQSMVDAEMFQFSPSLISFKPPFNTEAQQKDSKTCL